MAEWSLGGRPRAILSNKVTKQPAAGEYFEIHPGLRMVRGAILSIKVTKQPAAGEFF